MATSKGQQHNIDRTKAELRKLEDARLTRKAELDNLEAELRSLVVAARAGKSADAQAGLERAVERISKLRTDDTFDSIAIEELSARLCAEEAALRREQWKERCRGVRELIQRRVRWDKEQPETLLSVVLKIREKLLRLQALDAEILNALRELKNPLLLEQYTRLQFNVNRTSEIVSARLHPVVQSPFSSQFLGGLSCVDPASAGYAEQALRLLDEIAETMPGEEATRKAAVKAPPASAAVKGAEWHDMNDLPGMAAVGLKP